MVTYIFSIILENLLQYVTTMVCIAVKGQPIIGVIYKPFETKQNYSLFWTWVNYGVSRNLKNLPKVNEMVNCFETHFINIIFPP